MIEKKPLKLKLKDTRIKPLLTAEEVLEALEEVEDDDEEAEEV